MCTPKSNTNRIEKGRGESGVWGLGKGRHRGCGSEGHGVDKGGESIEGSRRWGGHGIGGVPIHVGGKTFKLSGFISGFKLNSQ